MGMKQFLNLTFIFLLLVCLAHSVAAITDQERSWQFLPAAADGQYLATISTSHNH
ncbi:MAG: hypothetical protein ACK5PS_12300 [Desulfopila sp.]